MHQSSELHDSLTARGGALSSTTVNGDDKHVLNLSTGKIIASAWGTIGVAYILIKAIKRVIPIALEPFGSGAMRLSGPQLG